MLSCDYSSVMRAEILRGGLQFLQRPGRFFRHRLNDIEHLRDRFAEFGHAFAGEHLAVAGAAGGFVSLRDIDRRFAEQARG